MKPRALSAGFSLIEVMIAIAILAMAMVTVFGSNIGAARNTARSRRLTAATMMARCRMVEIDAYLVKNQLPDTDTTLEDPPETGGEPCCVDGVTCDAIVEKIELPSPTEVETNAGDALLGRTANAATGSAFGGPGGTGGLGALAAGGGDGGVGSPFGMLAGAMGAMGSTGASGGSGSLTGSGAPSPREMAGAMMSTVYPTLKPMLEGAIRRVTVTARWHEGSVERSFRVVQYVTNPGQTLSMQDAQQSTSRPPNVQLDQTGRVVTPGGGGGGFNPFGAPR